MIWCVTRFIAFASTVFFFGVALQSVRLSWACRRARLTILGRHLIYLIRLWLLPCINGAFCYRFGFGFRFVMKRCCLLFLTRSRVILICGSDFSPTNACALFGNCELFMVMLDSLLLLARFSFSGLHPVPRFAPNYPRQASHIVN